jgi:hypothetical protein
MLVEKLAFVGLQLARVYKADAEVTPLVFEEVKNVLVRDRELTMPSGLDAAALPKTLAPELLIRYASHFERQVDRTLGQLERWRGLREAAPLLIEAKVSSLLSNVPLSHLH